MLTLITAMGISFANGANDNGKGVATLIGSRTLQPRPALWFAHLATLAGAIMALFIGHKLMVVFSGKGFLPDEVLQQGNVMAVVASAAAGTVMLATIFRIPISTTHALTGGLVGVSFAQTGTVVWSALAGKFLLPLLFSPLLSAVAAYVLYRFLHRARLAMGVTKETCVCIGPQKAWVPVVVRHPPGATLQGADASAKAMLGAGGSSLTVTVGDVATCGMIDGKNDLREMYVGRVVGFSAAGILNAMHVLSAGLVSAARGMNDTPKLAALMVGGVAAWSMGPAVGLVAVAMLAGGALLARRVTATMSERITEMNPGSGMTANAVAAALVLLATLIALPVSTTHVTCGALFGIGIAHGQAHWRMVRTILLAWVATLPMAAALAFAISTVL